MDVSFVIPTICSLLLVGERWTAGLENSLLRPFPMDPMVTKGSPQPLKTPT